MLLKTTKDWHKLSYDQSSWFVAGVAGLEPTLTVLETVALPLNYTPMAICSLFFATLISISSYEIWVNRFVHKLSRFFQTANWKTKFHPQKDSGGNFFAQGDTEVTLSVTIVQWFMLHQREVDKILQRWLKLLNGLLFRRPSDSCFFRWWIFLKYRLSFFDVFYGYFVFLVISEK